MAGWTSIEHIVVLWTIKSRESEWVSVCMWWTYTWTANGVIKWTLYCFGLMEDTKRLIRHQILRRARRLSPITFITFGSTTNTLWHIGNCPFHWSSCLYSWTNAPNQSRTDRNIHKRPNIGYFQFGVPVETEGHSKADGLCLIWGKSHFIRFYRL